MTTDQPIPDDVMREAWEITSHHWASDTGYRRAMAVQIARALLAERQRAAEIVRSVGRDFTPKGLTGQAVTPENHAKAIANAILAQGDKP